MSLFGQNSFRKSIRAVLLDVDGTLYDQAAVRGRMALRLLGFSITHPYLGLQAARAIHACRQAQELLRQAGVGNVASQQLPLAAKRAGQSQCAITAAFSRWMESEPLAFLATARFPGVVEFCDWARSSHITLGVVSDYPSAAKLTALGLLDYMSIVVTAQDPDVDSFKPSPKGLLKAIKQIGVRPDEVLYIGDRADVDLVAASAAGVNGILLGPRKNGLSKSVSSLTWPELHLRIAQEVQG